MTHTSIISSLLSDPERLIQRRPYTRCTRPGNILSLAPTNVSIAQKNTALIPSLYYQVIPEAQLLAELDPHSHKVLFDDNIPSITVKTPDGKGFHDMEYARLSIPFQRLILDKQVLHTCSAPMLFTLLNTDPTDQQQSDFIVFKQGWTQRNMDGHKTDFFRKAKSVGSAACLFYYDYLGRCKARTLSYIDGYQICPHRDDNGDIILVSIYYEKDDILYIDSYDDSFMYRYTNDASTDSDRATAPSALRAEGSPVGSSTWRWHTPRRHGFSEIPVVVKSDRVAWDRVQNIIEVTEVNVNIFSVNQKKMGWGLLYVKGQFQPKAQKIAGSIILNDSSGEAANDAKFLTPPPAQNMIEYLDHMSHLIQLGSGTTFLLPKDIKISGDTSGLAIQLTQELDMETARNNIREWQNCASKMARLFKEGFSHELVASSRIDDAVTRFDALDIDAKFQVWRPQSDTDFTQMLSVLRSAGGISQQTLVEKNPVSTPDEIARIDRERQAEAARAAAQTPQPSQPSQPSQVS